MQVMQNHLDLPQLLQQFTIRSVHGIHKHADLKEGFVKKTKKRKSEKGKIAEKEKIFLKRKEKAKEHLRKVTPLDEKEQDASCVDRRKRI